MKKWFLMMTWMALAPLAAMAREPIQMIEGVRSLSRDEAESRIPVRVRAIVTFADELAATLFIHDERHGIYVDQAPLVGAVWPDVGDRVEVVGVTDFGVFAPVIRGPEGVPPTIRILGKGSLPPPRVVDGEELAKPSLDCDWVEVEADVTEVLIHDGDLVFQCRAGACDFHALVEGPLPADLVVPWDLAERRARIHGVVATIFNSNGQMTRRFLRVNSPADVVPVRSEQPQHKARLVGSSHLLRLNGPGPDELVRVQGVVTFAMPGRGMFLRTDGGGLWAQTARSPRTRPGAVVEVEGWPRAGTMRPFIRASGVEELDRQAPPDPIHRRPSELLAARFDSELVSCDAELINTFHGADGATLELRNGPVVFRGWLDQLDGRLPNLLPGSRVRVAGIAQITATGEFNPMREEDKLLLRLRSPADLKLLKPPPWWTPQRQAWAFGAVLIVMSAFYQRSRLRRKRRLESQRRAFEAVLAERGRFAREIHDSLAQGLTSISMQLECIRSTLSTAPADAASHLETARELVRDNMREARRTIWNLRPLALGEADLASALGKYANDLTRDTAISCRQHIEGTPRPLPREHEQALLRIGQESLTNAVRHASARRVDVRLRFGDDWVTLVVKDDGCGFDVADRVGKGYGLPGMHERVEPLGGSLSIDSHPGEGTEVSVTLPT